MRQLQNRVKAGVMALALAFAQVVVPVSPAFAAPKSGTDQPVWCQKTGQGWISVLGDANSENPNRFPLSVLPADHDTEIYLDGGQVYAPNRSDDSLKQKLDEYCGAQYVVDPEIEFTTKAECGPNNDLIAGVATSGVTFSYSTWANNSLTATATLQRGYEWSTGDATAPRTFQFSDQAVACPTDDKPATAVNGVFKNTCGDEFNLTFTPMATEGVTYVQTKTGNTLRVTATAEAGYVLTDPNWSQSQTDDLKACPTIQPCEEISTNIVSKYEDFADYDETRATGHTEFTKDGLRIWTEGSTNTGPRTDGKAGTWGTDKVAWYNLVTPYPFAEIGTPSIKFDNTTGGGVPGMQILFDKDGNGSIDAILVGEAGYYEGRWWSNAADLGVPSRDGYTSSATLQEYLTANPDSKVAGVGFSLGSGVKGDGLLKSLTFGCQNWVFKKAPRVPTQCTVSNKMYDRVWQYNGVSQPVNGPMQAGLTGTFSFQDEGLHINTPKIESYAYGWIDAGNVPMSDISKMQYDVKRLSKSAGFEATLPAYRLSVDTNGLSIDGGVKNFYYEPYYNDQSRAAAEDVFQTWDAYAGGEAKWYMGGTGQELHAWDQFVAQYPDAVVLAYGFNQGTWNAETYAVVQNIAFHCETTKFRYFQGMGGVTPDKPVIPVQETNQGQGAAGQLPAELPMTGAGGTISTWFALLAAVLTYGAVLFLQPKKRLEE